MSPMKTKKIERQVCEVFSRVCGYMRPVQNWNDAAKAQFKSRKTFINK